MTQDGFSESMSGGRKTENPYWIQDYWIQDGNSGQKIDPNDNDGMSGEDGAKMVRSSNYVIFFCNY